MAVDDSGARDKARRMLDLIARAAAEGAQRAAEEITANAMTRTPTIDEEYNTLMEGSGGISDVPRGPDGSADTDGRRRLIKDESTYLENVVPSSQDVQVQMEDGNGFVRFGNLPLLHKSTVWAYQNLRGKNQPSEPHEHNDPYFEHFEYGSLGVVIMPVFEREGNGSSFYPLRPDEIRTLKSMLKPVRAHHIFASESLEPIFRNAMELALSQVGPGKVQD